MSNLINDINNFVLFTGYLFFWLSTVIFIISLVWYIYQASQGKGQGLVDFIKRYLVAIIFSIVGILLVGVILDRIFDLLAFKYIWYFMLAFLINSVNVYWLVFVANKSKSKGFNLPTIFHGVISILGFITLICTSFSIYQKVESSLKQSIRKEYQFSPPSYMIFDSLNVLKGDVVYAKTMPSVEIFKYRYLKKVDNKKYKLKYWDGNDFEVQRARSKIKSQLNRKCKELYDNRLLINIHKNMSKKDDIISGLFTSFESDDTTRFGSKFPYTDFYFNKDINFYYNLGIDNKGKSSAKGFSMYVYRDNSTRGVILLIKSEIQKRLLVFNYLLFLYIAFFVFGKINR